MRIIISPAKKMNVDTDSFLPAALPQFLEDAETILTTLRALPAAKLQTLWKCSDALAELNLQRLETMDLHKGLTPALFAYEGIQYQYIAPGALEQSGIDYLREHLRILSGFYGLLRPFDGVTPYRLEMQAKLPVSGCKDLYAFWGRRLADTLSRETDLIVNLASKEYSRAVAPYLPPSCRFLTCTFAEEHNGKLVERGTACKMARGQMVRYMAEHATETPEGIQDFDALTYRFSPEHSSHQEFVFIKGGT